MERALVSCSLPRFVSVSADQSSTAGCNTVRANDAAHFLSFLKVLRSTIGKKKLITAAVSAAGFIGIDGEPITSGLGAFAKYLDYVNLMTVGYFSDLDCSTSADPYSHLQYDFA